MILFYVGSSVVGVIVILRRFIWTTS